MDTDSREKEKRIKIDVESKQLGLLMALEFRSAEVAKQPGQAQ